uniref:DNA-directed RNA polymerase subunit delta n=1 Tax=Candidatus Ventrenecus sp. TaxID=3085654 RepID=UPI003FEE9AB8
MKKLNELTEEEIENLGYDELAYKILEETNKKMKITDLFRQVCDLKGLSEADYENLIGDFFEILTTDKKFIMLENGFWDLKSRHSEKLVVEEDDDFEEENEEPDEEEETDVDDNYYDEDEVEDDSDNDLKDLVVIDDEDNMSE